MSRSLALIACLFLFVGVSFTSAGGLCRPAVVSNQTTLTVVPFAVPVAVPVATFASPAVLYSYQQQAAAQPGASAPAQVKPAAVSLEPSAILSRHCAECHRGPTAPGKLTLFGVEGQLLDKLPRHVIVDAVIPDEQGPSMMPPAGRARLTADEVRALRRWTTLSRDVVF